MKRLFGTIVAAVGGALSLWALTSLLVTQDQIFGYHPMWPGLVGKGGPDAEPTIDLDTMLELTAKARANGTKFDGVDLFLFDPHVNIDSTNDDLERLADKIRAKGLVVGSLVAPVWPPTGGGGRS